MRFKIFFLCSVLAANAFAQTNWPPVPPQDQGLPYTRSAQKFAVEKIGDTIAVFAGSRYAWVHGFKVRLDDVNWRDEAVLRDGKMFVPAAFAAVLDLAEVKPAPAPSYLAERWVYSLEIPKSKTQTIQIDGKDYVPLADEAQKRDLKVFQNERGLLLISKKEISFSESESNLLDTVITLFDTPEKFADPSIATCWVPSLKRQGAWTNYVKVTPEQLKIYSGPETKWATAPKSSYDFSGLNKKLLGSKVPPPGVYPRVLFSPEDVPMLAAHVKSSKIGQKSLIEMAYLFGQSFWNTNTSDGKIFQKLANNDLAGLEWPDDVHPELVSTLNTAQQFKGEKPGIFNTHVAYLPECFTSMSLYCLLTGDDFHGRLVATAIANYYKLREPLIDAWNAMSDSQFGDEQNNSNGSATGWRGMHGLVAHMNLGLALDFGGKWMTPEQKDVMRRVIAKATYGRRAYGEDNTVRFRDVNWVGWDLPQYLALTAIEGLEGFDREAWEQGRDTVRAFCDFGIDDAGVVYESNGKTPGSFQFITLSLVASARRGENYFGHPHLRKLLEAQTQMTSPNGKVTVNSGTQYAPFSRQFLSPQLTDELKSFFPRERIADYLLTKITTPPEILDETTRGWAIENFDTAKYREQVKKVPRLRLPSPTYPGFVPGVLYDSDFEVTTRADLDLPLDFNAPVHGVFSSYSDRTTNAAWINLMVRPDHYLGAGHHHADAGQFHFSALGVDWFTQSPFMQTYDGNFYNLVLVDGISEATSQTTWPTAGILGWNAAGKYLGATENKSAASASADLTYAYSYRWLTQSPPVWTDDVVKLGWEPDPSPEILKIFAGTARYKMRPWWSSYDFANYMPTCRAPFNPMKNVFRTVGLVRGKNPYGFIADDLVKDDASHLYQWQGAFNGGVWQADVAGLPPNEVVLAYREGDPNPADPKAPALIQPQRGEPLLLVCALGLQSGETNLPPAEVQRAAGALDRKKVITAALPFPHSENPEGTPQYFNRLVFNHRGTDAHFRVLLIPFRAGDELPKISFADDTATVTQNGQCDVIKFVADEDVGTRVTVTRDSKKILSAK
jgi:hypothetical protein